MKRMICIAAVSALVSTWLLPGMLHAQIIICKDASGRTITSDRPLPECADRAQRVMDRSGIVRKEIPAPLTPEQKKQKRADEERAKLQAAIEEKEKQNDLALLARYPNERDIESARIRSLEPIKDQHKREMVALAAAETELAKAQSEADRLKGKPSLPVQLQQRLHQDQQNVNASLAQLKQREIDIADANTRYDNVLKRFRELTKAAATN